MNREYFGIYYNYKQRIGRQLLGPLLLAVIVITLILSNHTIITLAIFWIVIILIFGFLIYFANYNAKEFIYQVRLESEFLTVSGETYNYEWQIEMPISTLKVQFRYTGSRFKKRYILQFSNSDYKFEINEYENWSHQKLAEIYEQIKLSKNEKIIIDEKLTLNNVKELS